MPLLALVVSPVKARAGDPAARDLHRAGLGPACGGFRRDFDFPRKIFDPSIPGLADRHRRGLAAGRPMSARLWCGWRSASFFRSVLSLTWSSARAAARPGAHQAGRVAPGIFWGGARPAFTSFPSAMPARRPFQVYVDAARPVAAPFAAPRRCSLPPPILPQSRALLLRWGNSAKANLIAAATLVSPRHCRGRSPASGWSAACRPTVSTTPVLRLPFPDSG